MRKGDLVRPNWWHGRPTIHRIGENEFFRIGMIAENTLHGPGLISVIDFATGKRVIVPIMQIEIFSHSERKGNEIRENIISKVSSGDQA
jgi:hypothetical protein